MNKNTALVEVDSLGETDKPLYIVSRRPSLFLGDDVVEDQAQP
jgi:hypothetical protein